METKDNVLLLCSNLKPETNLLTILLGMSLAGLICFKFLEASLFFACFIISFLYQYKYFKKEIK